MKALRRGRGRGSSPEDHFFDLKTWLESVLKNYCSQLVFRKTPQAKATKFSFDGNLNDLTVKPIDLTLKVIDIKLHALPAPAPEDENDGEAKGTLPKRVNETLRAELKYILGGDRIERKENFLIEIASVKLEKSKEETLPKFIETEAREIDFYTQVITKLEDWSFVNGSNIELGVPICFYGKYHYDQEKANDEFQSAPVDDLAPTTLASSSKTENPSSKNPFLSSIASIGSAIKKLSQHSLRLNPNEIITSEAMSILITNDLENTRFQVNTTNLSIGEVKAALRELAQIHAVSWAFEADLRTQRNGGSLLKLWPFLLKPEEAIGLASTLVESRIEPVLALLKLKLSVEERKKYEKWLTQISMTLQLIFEDLLNPPHPPMPSTIIHLDLQYQNIAFRPKSRRQPPSTNASSSSVKPKSSKSSKSSKSGSSPNRKGKRKSAETSAPAKGTKDAATPPAIDCRISNWKIASYGSPLHDVAFLFLTSLAPDVREAVTPKLLQYYYEVFQDTAFKYKLELPFTLKMLQAEYKKYFFCAFLFVLGNFEEPSPHATDDTNFTSIEAAYPYFDNFLYAMQEVMDNGF